MASHVTERSVGSKRLRVDGFAGFFRRKRSRLIFPGLHLGAIFRRENLGALQILLRVDVLRFLLLALFLGAFLASRFGDILRPALCGAKNGAEQKKNSG